jgi:hypothetical protein
MLTPEERKVIEFLIQDVRKEQMARKDDLETPAFDEAYQSGPNKTEPDYKTAIEIARAYCSFYSNKEVREVRRLAQKYVSLCEIKPQIAQMLSDAHKEDFVLNIRRALQGLVYSQKGERVIKKNDDETVREEFTIYSDGEGTQLENYEPSLWQIVLDQAVFGNIDTYYRLFNDQYLWVKMRKTEIENNARTLIGPLTIHLSLFELAIKIDAQYPFASVVNDEKAIVMGLDCDFENDDIKIILAEPGGKLSYISSRNLDEVAMVGNDRIVKEPISSEQAVNDFGISLERLPESTKQEEPSEPEPEPIVMKTEGQYKGFNVPKEDNDTQQASDSSDDERPPHENFGTLGADNIIDMESFDSSIFDTNYGDNYKNSVASASYGFENGYNAENEEEDDDEEFSDDENFI